MTQTKPEDFPFGDGSSTPLYMTNGCCEPTHLYLEELFDKFNLEKGDFETDFYPLTPEEEKYIGEDWIALSNGYGALTGYTALYKGEKYLMPSIEVYHGHVGELSEEEAKEYGLALVAELKPRLEAIGGHVFFGENHDLERHLVQVLVPFKYAYENANSFEEWKSHLEETLLNTDLPLQNVESPAP